MSNNNIHQSKPVSTQSKNAAEQQSNGYCQLTDWQLLQVAGDDATEFLQNLLTNDIHVSQQGQAQLTAFCQAKGRLLGIFWLIRRDTDFLLLMPADQIDFISQRLQMFKLRSQVSLEKITDVMIFGLCQPPESLAAQISLTENLSISLVNTQDQEKAIADFNAAGLNAIAANHWYGELLQTGLPMIYADSRELFTAQQVNLDLADGVSFRKGCYPGQEVVARLHYLGEAKRRLFVGTQNIPANAKPGTEIVNDSGNVAGHLVQAVEIDERQFLLQMTLKLAGAEQDLLLNSEAIRDVRLLADG